MIVRCPLCGSIETKQVYKLNDIPVFQNKVYEDVADSEIAVTGDVVLYGCLSCDFIWNEMFDSCVMDYDEKYQNEQANSIFFQAHLDDVYSILSKKEIESLKVVEVGCGKGFFLERLWKKNIDAIGFDPAYEGNHPRIIKDYFSEKYQSMGADLIILRHTLEHIQQPFKFIQGIARANNYQGKIYIEVPDIEWIIKKNAFWDVFYEHCNYFSLATLCSMFKKVLDSGNLFGGQYLYLVGDLSSVDGKMHLPKQTNSYFFEDLFYNELKRYKAFVRKYAPLVIWGAGAKGSTFCNMMDPRCEYISGVIDINTKKQNRYIAGTGHKIHSPENLSNLGIENVLIMNENYLHEVRELTNGFNVNLFTLGIR